jgi:modulator of FtsH protease
MTAYAPVEWHDFFLGTAGASAALTGLLFVAISINLQQILKYPNLPSRAAGTLGILVASLVVATVGLAPGQSTTALGTEIAVAGAAIITQALWVSRRGGDSADRLVWRIQRLVTLLLPGVAFTVGGVSLGVGGGGGLYWVVAGTVLAFLVAAINAWVLLVEVLR